MPEILAYFDHPVTNAYTESLNSLIRVMNRLGRGYSFEALRAKLLFAEGALKPTNSHSKFERRAKARHGVPDDVIGMGLPELAAEKPARVHRERIASTQSRRFMASTYQHWRG